MRRKSPARVSFRRRRLARRMESKPATTCACSRSMTRMMSSSPSKCRSRGCKIALVRLRLLLLLPAAISRAVLFPVIEHLPAGDSHGLVAALDFGLDLVAFASPASETAAYQAFGVVGGRRNFGHHGADQAVVPAFQNQMPARQVPQFLGQGPPAIEGAGNLFGVARRKLKIDVAADGRQC